MTTRAPRGAASFALALILLVAGGVRFWGLDFGLPHTQARPDETHIIEAARTLLSGDLPEFHDYPWLYVYMVSALYLGYFVTGLLAGTFHSVADMVASWPINWPPFFLLSRALAATFGTATVYVVFKLGRRLWGEPAALLAAAFMALAFIHARDSHFGTTDAALVFFIVACVDLLVGAHQRGEQRLFAASGFVGGLAAATKYNALLLIAPIVMSYTLHVATAREKVVAVRDPRLFTFGLTFLAAFIIGIPFVLVDRAAFAADMRDLLASLANGAPQAQVVNGWVYHATHSLRYGLGAPLLAASLAGVMLLIIRMPAKGLLLLAFPAAYYGVAGGLRTAFFRYTLPMVPFLCLSASYGVEQAGAWLASWSGQRNRTSTARAATLLLATVVIAPSALNTVRFARIAARADNRVVVSQWFSTHVPAGSSVLQSGSRYGHAQFERRMKYQEWLWDGRGRVFRLNGQPATGEPDWIVLQDSPLPSSTQARVGELLSHDYQLVATFKALSRREDLVYDRQDMFYVPFSGLQHVTRPGPNFVVYARREVASQVALPVDR